MNKPVNFHDTQTGLIVTIGIVLSMVNEHLLPLRATAQTTSYAVTVDEFLSDRFIEMEGAN
jgi:hypothetical protein